MFEEKGFSDWFKENTPKEGLSENTTFSKQFLIDAWNNGYSQKIIKLQKELEEEKKLNAEIKARFVKCNTCTDEMKLKCLMFTENLCEGERCEELIDIVSLVNKSELERKIEELEKEIKHKNKQLRAEFEAQIENIDLKEQIKTIKKYLDCDFCEYQNNKDECHQCNYLEKTRWTLKKE